MSVRRLLVVTYYYPPQPGSGSNRWAAMVKHLRRQGHDVTVLTAAPPGHPAGEQDGVLRTGSLNASPLLRRVLLRGEREGSEAASAGGGTLPPALWKGVVPDPWLVTWNPAAWLAARRLLVERSFDCLITSSPANSTHLIALALGRRRPPWIADFRDGWGFEPLLPPFPTAPQRALDRRLEARVARGAEAVVAVTAPIAEDFRARLGVEAEHVPNGWDTDLDRDASWSPATADGTLTLVHAGALSGPWGRDPRPLLEALRRLLEERPEARGRVRLVLAGREDEQELAMLREAGLGEAIEHRGYIPREQSIALQRGAGALLLITSRNRGEATGKLYEYMAAGRPVIALADGNEAARLVAETNIGVLAPPDDVEAIKGALALALSGELERRYAPRGTERYTYPPLAQRMAEVVELAVERRAASALRS